MNPENRPRSRWTLVVATAFVAVALALTLGELGARFTSASTRFGYFPEFPYIRDPAVGWRHTPNARVLRRTNEFEITIATNSEGFRSEREFITGGPGARVIAILGDSMVQGIQVEEDSTLASLLEHMSAASGVSQVQNYGVSHFGMPHYLQTYRYYARNHHPDVVVVCILDQNDIANSDPIENTSWITPTYLYDADGNITGLDPFPPLTALEAKPFSVRSFLRKHSSLYRLVSIFRMRYSTQIGLVDRFPKDALVYEEPWNEASKRGWRHASWALRELCDAIRDDSAFPLIVLLPGKWTTSDPVWQSLQRSYPGTGRLDRDKVRNLIRAFAAEIGVTYVDLTGEFKRSYKSGRMPHFKGDGHLTPLGHRIAARAINDALIDSPQ